MNNWKNVSVCLPEEGEIVLVWIKDTWYVSCFSEGTFFDEEGVDTYSGVTHWMRPIEPE
ncbi:hypothetical protein [Acinetobacter phage vB_AbM_WUPSU]|nr:hypothetical protein [Acinetobacter phage vB_AbM_WUPSU]